MHSVYSVMYACVCFQMLMGTSLSVNTLVKVKEGLLGQRELEIDRYCRTFSKTLRTCPDTSSSYIVCHISLCWSTLNLIDGNLNAQRYREEILKLTF